MSDCLNRIVTFGICPDEGPSTSGFTLLSAPGISVKNLENIATETYMKGTELAMQKKALAIALVRNDLIAAMQANRVVTQMSVELISSGQFNTAMTVPASTAERGITLHKAGQRGKLRQTFIKEVKVYPLQSGAGKIKIYDGDNVTIWDVTLVAGQVNVFDADTLGGFPFMLPANANARVVMSAPGISFAQSKLTCLSGCQGLPNQCGWVDGWDGNGAVKTDGFGMNLTFYCECNYGQILCDMATSFAGELIWLKWQMAIFEEQLMSNRFNNWVVYNADALRQETLPNLQTAYNAKWEAMMNGLFGILQNYKDPCINCRGVRWVTNV